MARMRMCSNCGTSNAAAATECKQCGNSFSRHSGDSEPERPPLCDWNDVGRTCPYPWVVKIGDRRLCRQHLDEYQQRAHQGNGNYPAQPVRRSSHMRQWDGWKYNPKTKRLEREQPEATINAEAEDLTDVLPEEASQA